MPVNAISQSDNRRQNNIMAASAAIIAGTGGAAAGYNLAPRAVKSIDELLTCKADVFCKTLDNMEKAKTPQAKNNLRKKKKLSNSQAKKLMHLWLK